jgi:molybdate transport system substrate-binding protein
VTRREWLLVLALTATGCGGRPTGSAATAQPLTVAAAADLRFALDELTPAFEKSFPGAHVAISYGSSGSFYAELLNGAPFDVFLSADVTYPQKLIERGLAEDDSRFTYGFGRIVVWTRQTSKLPVESNGLNALVDPSVTHVAIANPEHAPYGRAAEAALQSAGVLKSVRPKLVYGENIAQAMQFVQSGAAEVGIVALSLAAAPAVSGRYFLIPDDSYPPIEQGGVVLRSAKNIDGARALRAFLQSAEARTVLERYGFRSPREDAAAATDAGLAAR